MTTEATKYDTRHGGPYDRGAADYYYWRAYRPHYFEADTYTSPEVTDLTPAEIEAYKAGYEEAEAMGDRKDWG